MDASDYMNIFNDMESDEEVVREDIVKAPFSYPGGKVTAMPNILPHLPYTDYYCEPFGGSGAILLARRHCKNEYFNDRYSGVTDFYKCVKDKKLCQELVAWVDFSPTISREYFIDCRNSWKNVYDPVERAGKWYVMMMSSFQAYGRHMGRSKTSSNGFSMKIPNALQLFWPVHERLKGVYIENQDWRQMLRDLNHVNRVWYFDPPYLATANSNLGMYEHTMSYHDHVTMCEMIFNNLEGYVALSGYDNELYNSFPWDRKESWIARETSSAKIGTESNNRIGTEGNNKGERVECLWIKEFRK